MGCRNPTQMRLCTITDAPLACFLYDGRKISPDLLWSGGHANILNKQHNSSDCFEPPGHLCFVMVVFVLCAQRRKERKQIYKGE